MIGNIHDLCIGSKYNVIFSRILLVQLIEANNSLVVLEPKLVAYKTENTQKPTEQDDERTTNEQTNDCWEQRAWRAPKYDEQSRREVTGPEHARSPRTVLI